MWAKPRLSLLDFFIRKFLLLYEPMTPPMVQPGMKLGHLPWLYPPNTRKHELKQNSPETATSMTFYLHCHNIVGVRLHHHWPLWCPLWISLRHNSPSIVHKLPSIPTALHARCPTSTCTALHWRNQARASPVQRANSPWTCKMLIKT